MTIKLTEVSEVDFKASNAQILFENSFTDRAFAVISNGVSEYKFGWQSTDIKPVVTSIRDAICSIGIDLTFIVFDYNKREILIKLSLDYFFYDVRIYNHHIFIITELEIIKIRDFDFLVINTYALPDYFEGMEFEDGIIEVKCIGEKAIKIEMDAD